MPLLIGMYCVNVTLLSSPQGGKLNKSQHGAIRLIRDGELGGKGVWRWGKRESVYLSLRCHHQSDSCIKMGRDKSHSNVE